MKKIINVLVVLIISISMFAQTDYYYFKGQRIPLTVNPKKVNIISMAIGPQFAPAVNPNALPAGLEVEAVIPGNPYNMCVIENKTSNIALLHNYLNYIVNPNYNIVLPCYYDYNGKELFTTNKIYIELKNSTDFIKLQSVISVYNLLIIRQNKYMPLWYTVSITKQTPYNTIQMANILYELGYFLSVEPEFRFNAKESISWDTYVGEQWGLYNATDNAIDINASSAWNYATGRGVKVAIVDSGMDWNHEDLKDNIGKKYYDTLVCDSVRCVYETHGTSVSGIILSSRNNGKYISGISPDVEPIIISSILDYVSPEELANGINWACENDADIINCSWNTTYSKPILCALEKAIYKGRKGKGCIVVKSAGNSNSGLSFPADSIPELLVVGAIKRNGLRYLKNDSVGSSYGKNLDVVSPGDSILSTYVNNELAFVYGTSMAAPFVSGVAALILELNPDLTGQQVRDIIEQSTTKVGMRDYEGEYTNTPGRPNGTWNQYYGYGLVDALKAVQNTPRKQINY